MQLLHVQLFGNDLLEQRVRLELCPDKHLGEGLTVFQAGLITSGTAQSHDLQHLLHLTLQLGVNGALIAYRVVAQVHALGSVLVQIANQILINVLSHEGNHGSGSLGSGDQRGVQGLVSVDLVLGQLFAPETLAAAAHIPVTHIIHKVLQSAGSFGDAVVFQIGVHFPNHGIQLGKQPLVHNRKGIFLPLVLVGIELVDIGIQHIECIGVPQGGKQLSLAFAHGLAGEALGNPRGGAGVEVPADGVCAVSGQCLKGVNSVALGLGHLLAVFVLHMAQHDDVLKGSLVEDQSGDSQQGVEPAAGLVNGFGDEVGGELLLEQVFILKGIVMLGKGHGAGVEPAVDNLGDALHLLAAVGAGDGHGVDEGAVQLDVVGAVGGHGFQFLNAADGVTMAAFALPDVQRGAPVTVTADAPVLDIFQPVAETALADGLGNPVDGVVIADQVLFYVGHADEPAVAGVIDEGGIAAPAVGIAVGELGRREQQAAAFQILQHFLVGVLAEHAGPLGFLGHFALGVHQLDKGQTVFPAHVGVVLTKGGSNVNHAGTVGQSDVLVTGDIPALFLGFHIMEQGFVLFIFQIFTHIGFQNGVGAFAQYGIAQGMSQIVYLAVLVHLDLDIFFVGVHAQGHVGGQGPGGGGPCQNGGILALHPETGDGGALFYVFIALGHFMAGQGGSAAGAIGHDFEALIQQALFPDLLQCPPLGLDKLVVIGNIGVIHVSPETDGTGEILPHALIFPHTLFAAVDKGFQTVFLDLLFTVQTQQFFHFQLYGQAVGIPTGLTGHVIALHGAIAGNHVLDGAGLHMANVGLTVGRGRTVIKSVIGAIPAHLHALFKNVFLAPEFLHLLFPFHKVQICGYLVVHGVSSFEFIL